MYSPQPQVMVAQQPMMMVGGMGGRVQNLASYAAPCLCPNCGQTQVTRVTFETGSHTHLWAVILGVLFCCCCIPYMIDGLKDVRHNCSNCGIPLAVWHRSGGLEVLAHQGTNVPLQAQPTGQQPLQPQQTGVPMQPQYTGAPVQTPPGQYTPQPGQFSPQHTGQQQPAYTGPAHP
ncbi:LITAF-like zinc ribbon domain-containing protein [Auriculariales sp. MPI-PUGE-AT-0066]|nr:LITAF-like zinc ribbon domain-containing protein [Auriculariales sp. MPI-PUGE-AT-0066]